MAMELQLESLEGVRFSLAPEPAPQPEPPASAEMVSQARLVVDATSWDQATQNAIDADDFFLALQEQVLSGPLKPVVLVVTSAQHDLLPLDLIVRSRDFRVVVVQDEEEARRRVAELSSEGRAVVSGRVVPDLSRWIAADYVASRRCFVFEPKDGFQQYADRGRLDVPRLPEHDLSLVEDSAEDAVRFDSACEARRLAYTLADEASLPALRGHAATPEFRLAAARALGVVAASTGRERLDHALDCAGIEPQPATDRELQDVLDRAARRHVGPIALLVDGEVHLINYKVLPDEIAMSPAVEVHTVRAAVPAIMRLRQLVESYTEDEAVADRDLGLALRILDPQGEQVRDLEHARWCLTISGAARRFVAVPRMDWRTSLEQILVEAPPACGLRLSVKNLEKDRNGKPTCDALSAYARRPGEHADPRIFVTLPPSARDFVVPIAPLDLHPRRSFCMTRVVKHDAAGDHASLRVESYKGEVCRTPPAFSDPTMYQEVDPWLDLVEGTSAGDVPTEWRVERTGQNIPDEVSDAADNEAALLWVALRHGLGRGTFISRHDGVGILDLGGGLAAIVSARASLLHESVSVSLPAILDPNRGPEPRIALVRDQVELGAERRGTRPPAVVGPFMPRTLHLGGHGLWVDVTFCGAPFLAGR